MNAVETPSFETDDHERIYTHIEHSGAVSPDGVHEEVPLESEQVSEIVDGLVRDGYLTEFNGRLQLALGVDFETTHQVDGTVVTIRSARQKDVSAIIETIQQIIANVRYPRAEDLVTKLIQDGVVKRHNGVETRVFFVSTVDDELVGWVHVGASTLQRLRQTVELTLGVRSELRERGIGSHLLKHGCEWAASNAYQKAFQRLPMTNERALSFLQSHNWEIETVRRNHYDRIDEVVMAIELSFREN